MESDPILLAVALAVGALIGAVGIGGILLIPALASLGPLGMHEAMATALFTFAFTGITGTVLFKRRGSIDWRLTAPVCAGALLCAFAGAWLASRVQARTLSIALATVILFAGIYTLAAWRGAARPAFERRPGARQALLAVIGAASGFGSGLTGVGGPALSVPLMVLFGFPALPSIGASQVIQIIAAVSGTIGNLTFGSIDFRIAVPVTIAEVVGVFAGAAAAHAVDPLLLRRFVAVLCLPVGAFLIVRAMS